MIDTTPLLQYKIELAVEYILDGPYARTDTVSRLQKLRNRREGWKTLRWAEESCLSALPDSLEPRVSGSIFAQMRRGSSLSCALLSSPSRNITSKTWSLDKLGSIAYGHAIDHGQDLLVVVDRR